MDLDGVTIDRYKIINELGRGGLAVVYRAIDNMLDRNVAIKILQPEISSKEKLLKRFNREAKTLANLSHSNIVKVLDFGDYEGTPYLVMEFISGGTLSTRLGKPINYAEAAAILAPVARALNYAHQQKVVHRDIKPANILLNDSGQAMLSDFGILKLIDLDESHGLTGTGKIIGTPAYMSPEQIRGKEIDGRSDIYSLGVVFFEMITGRKPYTANTPIELSMQHLHDPIPKGKQIVRDLPADVEQVIVKSMAKKPEERYQSMNAFANALEKLSGISTATPHSGWDININESIESPEKKQLWKNKTVIFLAAVIILLSLGAFFISRNGFVNAEKTATSTTMSDLVTVMPTKIIKPITETPIANPSLDSATPTALSVDAIKPSNVAQIIQTNRLDNISVIKTEWMQNGKWIINAGSRGISFIDPDEVSVKETIDLSGEIPISMAVSQTNEKLWVLLGNNVKVFDIQTLKLITNYSITGGAHSIAVSPDGKLIALGISDNKVQLITADEGRVVQNLRSNYGGWSVAFSPDSSLVAGGSSEGVLMWETNTGLWLPLAGVQRTLIKGLAFSNDGKTLAGGSKNIIFFWNVEDGGALSPIKGEFSDVNSMDFSPDNSILVTGSADGIVRLWDTDTGALLKSLTGHTSPIFSVGFSPSGLQIVSGANEGSIYIWGIP